MEQLACVCGTITNTGAGTQAICPACGRPLISVSLEPVRFGTVESANNSGDCFGYRAVLVAESTPPTQEEVYPVVEPVSRSADDDEDDRQRAREILRRVRRERPFPPFRPWKLEEHWWEGLPYPIRASGALVGLAFGFSLLFVVLLPLVRLTHEEAPWAMALAFWAGPAAVLIGYTCCFMNHVLTAALRGETRSITYPHNPVDALQSVFRCVVCFLAGPALLVAIVAWYWLNAGALALIDFVILADLLLVAWCYWFFAFFAVVKEGSLRAAAPVRVVGLVRELGFPATVVVLFFLAVIFVHLPWFRLAMVAFHRGTVFGSWFSIMVWSYSLLFAIAFLLRWLGVRCFRVAR